jgi:hypothetical protein
VLHASTVILLCTIVGASGAVMTGVVVCLRALWRIRGSWDATNAQLQLLVAKVADLIALKDRDHDRLERRADELAQRMERHLQWHDKH